MARIEVLNTWFFPIPTLRKDGKIMHAPKEAVEKYQELKEGWFRDFPEYPHEKPLVILSPGKEPGKEGYFVKTGIIYSS